MDQMEKKQITNSSTVSRAVKDPQRDQGWEPPQAWDLVTPSLSRLSFPRKEMKCVTFLRPSHHFSAASPPEPQEGFGSLPQEQDEPRVMNMRWSREPGVLREDKNCAPESSRPPHPHNSPFRISSSLGVNRCGWYIGFQRTNIVSTLFSPVYRVRCGGPAPLKGSQFPPGHPLADKRQRISRWCLLQSGEEVASLRAWGGRNRRGHGSEGWRPQPLSLAALAGPHPAPPQAHRHCPLTQS